MQENTQKIGRIYRRSKEATQSGMAKSKRWVLEFEHDGSRFIEPLMGWVGSRDMDQEIRLFFETKESAISFAEKTGADYEVIEDQDREIKPKSYASNFTKKVL